MGGLVRYRRRAQFDRSLTLQLLSGSVPGVVLSALIRVYVAADPDVFRLLAAAALAPVGLFILRKPGPARSRPDPGRHRDGGGHGGARCPVLDLGDLLGRGGTYAVISLDATDPISPDWSLGIATGVGGLAGGWLGASLQPHIPERSLRTLLGAMVLALALLYLTQVLG